MAAIDTSSIKMNPNEVKAALKYMYIAESGKTTQDLLNMVAMYEAKYERITNILMAGVTPESIALDAKNQRIKLQYFLIKKWLEGVRP